MESSCFVVTGLSEPVRVHILLRVACSPRASSGVNRKLLDENGNPKRG